MVMASRIVEMSVPVNGVCLNAVAAPKWLPVPTMELCGEPAQATAMVTAPRMMWIPVRLRLARLRMAFALLRTQILLRLVGARTQQT